MEGDILKYGKFILLERFLFGIALLGIFSLYIFHRNQYEDFAPVFKENQALYNIQGSNMARFKVMINGPINYSKLNILINGERQYFPLSNGAFEIYVKDRDSIEIDARKISVPFTITIIDKDEKIQNSIHEKSIDINQNIVHIGKIRF